MSYMPQFSRGFLCFLSFTGFLRVVLSFIFTFIMSRSCTWHLSWLRISRHHPEWPFGRKLFGKQKVYKGAWKECNVFYCAWGDHNLRKILVFSLRKASFCTLNLEVICTLLSCGWGHRAFDSPPSWFTEGEKKRNQYEQKQWEDWRAWKLSF